MTANCPNFQFDSVEVRPGAFQVLREGKPLPLEPKAVRVLLFLAENRDRAVGKEELMRAVWPDTAVTDNALTRVIAQLRRELGDDARQPRYIQTIPTLGYRFVADIRGAGPAGDLTAPPPRTQPRRTAAMFGAALTVAALAYLLTRGTAPPPARPHITSTQFTTSPGLDFSGGFSPDGRSMAYASDRSGRFEIYIRPVEGPVRDQQLTADGGQNIQPAWSPDGRWIAYHSVLRGGVWIVPAAGGASRQLADVGSQPAWSPDGKRLVYRSENVFSVSANDLVSTAKVNLRIVDIATGATRDLTRYGTPRGKHTFPTWSPDGKRILFTAAGPPRSSLWTVAPDGSDMRQVALRDDGMYIFPVFGPRGDNLYYGSFTKSRDFGIWRIPLSGDRADGEPVEIIRTGTAIPRELTISRDGKRLAYTASHQVSNLWSLNLNEANEPAGAPSPLYTDNVYRTSFPTFSPDGRKIAFFARLFGGQGDIWTMNADGSGAAPLTSQTTTDLLPNWTPDGQSVVYTRSDGGALQVWRVSVSDRSEQPLLNGKPLRGWPRLSPDGKELVWHDNRAQENNEALKAVLPGVWDPAVKRKAAAVHTMNIWKTALPGGESKQLTFDTEGAGYPAWSRDGNWICYEVNRGPHTYLALMNREGGGQKELHSTPGQNWVYDWSPDSRKVLFAAFRNGEWNLYWMDVSTGRERKLTAETSIGRYVRYPSWSPDGRRIVYEYGQTRGNVFLLNIDE